MRADVAIVGAGLFGSSLAVALARGGDERRDPRHARTPAAGDTGRSFGMVRAHYSNEVTVRLARSGASSSWLATRAPGYVRTGYMLPVAERDRAACAANVELGQSLGVDSRLLEPEAVAEVEPALRTDGIAAAAYEPDGGLVDPGRMTLAWFAEAVALGAEPRLGAEVTDLDALDAGTVVVAAGGWTSRLLPDIPISLQRIDVARVRPLRVSVVVSDTVTNVVVRPGVGDMAWAVAYREPEGYADRDEAPEAPEDGYRASVAGGARRALPARGRRGLGRRLDGRLRRDARLEPGRRVRPRRRLRDRRHVGPRPQAGAGDRGVRRGRAGRPRAADRPASAAVRALRRGRPAPAGLWAERKGLERCLTCWQMPGEGV